MQSRRSAYLETLLEERLKRQENLHKVITRLTSILESYNDYTIQVVIKEAQSMLQEAMYHATRINVLLEMEDQGII